MQDETQDENVTPDEPAPEEPAAPAGDEPASPAEPPAEAPAPAEEAPPAEEGEPADAPAEDGEAADAPAEPAEDAAADGESAQAPPASEPTPERAPSGERKSEEAPGADLEPIRLEEEPELSAEERARLEAEREEQARLEAAAVEEGAEEPLREAAKLELPTDTRIQATGKRKTSVARVVVAQGGGEFKVNRRALDEYFPRGYHQTIARQPLAASGYEGQVDVSVRVHGGGISGQADAVRHGIARALVEIDPELRGELKRRGMLTRDARAKERRKAGLKKARKRPQFSKR
jgi:small subunit ribosomal protein S9